jgi:hypothetical protein
MMTAMMRVAFGGVNISGHDNDGGDHSHNK